jgi:hypothetical protein
MVSITDRGARFLGVDDAGIFRGGEKARARDLLVFPLGTRGSRRTRTLLDGRREVHEYVVRDIEEDVDELPDDILLDRLGHGRGKERTRAKECARPFAENLVGAGAEMY